MVSIDIFRRFTLSMISVLMDVVFLIVCGGNWFKRHIHFFPFRFNLLWRLSFRFVFFLLSFRIYGSSKCGKTCPLLNFFLCLSVGLSVFFCTAREKYEKYITLENIIIIIIIIYLFLFDIWRVGDKNSFIHIFRIVRVAMSRYCCQLEIKTDYCCQLKKKDKY